MSIETCYMCSKEKTSREHVPPKCLFPESKNLDSGEDYRKNLIIVPACDEHNSAKSQDDELMLITFASNLVSEDIGGKLQHPKLMRIVDRKPHLFAKLLRDAVPVSVVDDSGKAQDTCAFLLDRSRFMKQMQSVANGIYFHHMNSKVKGKTKVVPIAGFQTTDLKVNENNQITKNYADRLFPGLPSFGDNPDIFFYQVSSDSPNMLMKMVFYRAIEFIAEFNIEESNS
ncbi:hypothetical protein [Vibrio metschnikovii]|uniref:hypothetical protein n=1 Tax=Vibrio metschnikovii TaxID=28172 RepID=UPI002FC5B90A